MNSRTDDLKCNSVLFQRNFLSTNPSSLSLWTAASSWQVCGVHQEDLPQGLEGAHLKILLDDTYTFELLMSVCNTFSQ